MCPLVNPGPVPHVGGAVTTGFATVLVGGLPAARVGDVTACVGPPGTIAIGSTTVMIGASMAARLNDLTSHGGMIVSGCPTVLIGNWSGGGSTAGPGAAPQGAVPQEAPPQGAVPGLPVPLNVLLSAQRNHAFFCERCSEDALPS